MSHVHESTDQTLGALLLLQRRLEAALLGGNVGLFEWQVSSDRVWGGPNFSRILNLPLDDDGIASLDAFKAALHPDDRDYVCGQIRQTIETGEPYHAEYRVATEAGQRWIAARGVAERDKFGRVVRIYGAIVDITSQRQAENELRAAREQLAQVNAELENKVRERTAELHDLVGELEHFSYTLTHHLRAPLRAMLGLTELLLEGDREVTREVHDNLLRRVAQAARRMDELITDALNYTKLLRKEHLLVPVDVAAMLHELVETYPELAPPSAEITIDDHIPPVLGDEAGLTQCFTNLLSNAVKFVAPGEVPRVRVWGERRSRDVRLWFEDNGIGIAAEHQEQIWQMFQRLDRGRPGTGVGLALIRKVVQRLGGRAGVDSEPGRGSRFWIELQSAAP